MLRLCSPLCDIHESAQQSENLHWFRFQSSGITLLSPNQMPGFLLSSSSSSSAETRAWIHSWGSGIFHTHLHFEFHEEILESEQQDQICTSSCPLLSEIYKKLKQKNHPLHWVDKNQILLLSLTTQSSTKLQQRQLLMRLNHPSQQQLSDFHPPTHKTDSQKLPLARAQESFPPWRCNVVILKLTKPNPLVRLSSKSLHSCKPKILQAPNTRFLQSTHQSCILLLQLQIPKSSCNPRIFFSSSATTWIHRKQTQTHCIKVSSGRRSELHLYSHVFFLGWKSLPRKSRFWGLIINSLSSFSFFSDWWFLFSGVRLSNDFCLGFQTWLSNSS